MESIIVGLIVAAAASYAVWALLPPGTRLRVARWLAEAAGRNQTAPGWLRRLVTRLETRASAAPVDCANCGTDHASKIARKPPQGG